MSAPSRARRIALVAAALGVAGAAAAATVLARDVRDDRPCRPADDTLHVEGTAPAAAAGDGRLLVANQFSGSATLVDLATGRVRHVDTGGEPHDAAVSPDGRWGVVSDFGRRRDGGYDGRRLRVIDMRTGRVARTIDTGVHRGLHDVAFRPGHPARALVTAQTSRHLLEVDVATGAVVAAIETRGDRSHLVAVTPDGRTAFTTNEGTATVSRLDLERRAFVASFPASPDVEGIAVAAGGRELWVGQPARGVVTVHDAGTGAVLATHAGFRVPVRIAASPDGRRVVISDPRCRAIAVADARTRAIVRTLRAPQDPPVLVGEIAPDGRTAFAAVGGERLVLALDLETGRVLGRHRTQRHPDGLGWGPAAR